MMLRREMLVVLWLTGLLTTTAWASPEREQHFEQRIRPVLMQKCFKCHGGEKTSGGLRVDSRQNLLKGGDQGAALVPGNAKESLLFLAVDPADDALKMPPDNPLSTDTAAAFAKWINDGAVWPKYGDARDVFKETRHWAFESRKVVEPPPDESGWSTHPIDRFIDAKRAKQGLNAVRPAEPFTLVRRATFDLTGLPPSPVEVASFMNAWKREPQAAYEDLLDRLLASPRYGERWARHWLDLVRYADTAGDAADYPVREARLYRDYVIDAFNHDKPYNQFVMEQLAGDLIAKSIEDAEARYAERMIATGFLALSRRFGGQRADYDDMHLTLEDTIDTVGQAFLGLTLQCARCHDHKFDPVASRDYYALYGIFQSTLYPYPGSEFFATSWRSGIIDDTQHVMDIATIRGFPPTVPSAKSRPQIVTHQQRIDELQTLIGWNGVPDATAASFKFTLHGKLREFSAQKHAKQEALKKLKADDPKHVALNAEIDLLNRQIQAARELIHLRREELPDGMPRCYGVVDASKVGDARMHVQGDPTNLGEAVARDVPAFLQGPGSLQIPAGESGRLQLAQWIASPQHPLAARVMANRIWQHHFGKGIVKTPSNFGLRGDAPTHPALLDWLANQFVQSDWSIKAMHRQIMTSQTYKLSATGDSQNASADPENHWYWRFDRRRLSAEEIRDAMLIVSGSLDTNRPGSHPFPPIDAWTWSQHSPFHAIYDHRHRSIFLMTQRSQRHPYLALFDAAPNDRSTPTRYESIVPTQSLYLLNSSFVSERASDFAKRILQQSNEVEGRVRAAYAIAWGRGPNEAEHTDAVSYLEGYRQQLAILRIAESEQEQRVWSSFCQLMLVSNEFLYVD